jgi:hypothetical protein
MWHHSGCEVSRERSGLGDAGDVARTPIFCGFKSSASPIDADGK